MQLSQALDSLFTNPTHLTQYRCLGVVKGIYKPSRKNIRFGTFIFETGENYPCNLVNKKLVARIREHRQNESNTEPKIYRTWIATSKKGVVKSFQLLSETLNPEADSPTNVFNLRGIIAQVDRQASIVKIAIARNETPPPGEEEAQEWQPFLVRVEGVPESAEIAQFWEIYARWQTEGKLAISKASYLTPMEVPESLKTKTESQKKEKTTTEKPKTEDKEKTTTEKPKTEGQKTTKSDSKTKTEVVQTTVSESKKPLQIVKINKQAVNKPEIEPLQSGPKKTTVGRLEITIKINTYPDNVKTLSNKSKQFDVDCDGQIVRITVKPKLWKKVEQAQEKYPMWVAAIAGKMGKAIANGFELDQPAIQAFEIKPKNPTAQTTSNS